MDLDMVFNELSIESPATDIFKARQWMGGFIDTVRAASLAGVNRTLRTHVDMHYALLAPEYPIARWRNDHEVDIEARRYFRSLTSQYPPLEDLPEIGNDMLSRDYYFNDKKSFGFGIAYLLESLAVSLPSDDVWNDSWKEVKTQWLAENGGLTSRVVIVPHASNPIHIGLLSEWISKRLATGIKDGNDLWRRRRELFPHLTLCDAAATHILPLHKGIPVFRQIIKRLFQLEIYCESWQSGSFSAGELPFKATPESEPTLRKYSKEREAICPNGNCIVFSWHGRITPQAWRIYFDFTLGPGAMHIGYIGPKLPTVINPT